MGPPPPPDATFLFADLAGFTALTEAHGDDQAADLVGDFCAAVRATLPEYGGQEVKSIGDAVMIRCETAAGAIGLGLRTVRDVGGRHGFPSVRVGMHTGPAVERSGDWFGASVNLAARVSGVASGDEVLLTEATQEAAGELPGVLLREHGRRVLRNVAEPVLLFSAVKQGERSATGLAIDPVCRMAVDPGHGAGVLRHDGVEYSFCSLACARAFAGAPGRYGEAGTP